MILNWLKAIDGKSFLKFMLLAMGLVYCPLGTAEFGGIPAISVTESAGGEQVYTMSIQVLVLMTVLTLLPGLVMTMTSFTRIIIVLSLLRQAMGTPQAPNSQVLVGLALFLSFFVMSPVINEIYDNAVTPYMEETINDEEALARAKLPIQKFMLAQTRDSDLNMFAQISGDIEYEDPSKVPFSTLIPAFVTSELKTAFQIGFLLFIPFIVIDLVVASVLMSMGMMMLSPLVISLPFKIMLFVLIDGWSLVLGTLASSFVV